jgi:hypothetical protein
VDTLCGRSLDDRGVATSALSKLATGLLNKL